MELVFSFAVMVAAIMGVVEAIKRAGLEAKFAPLVAIALGIGLAILAVVGGLLETNFWAAEFYGIVAGLSAVGLYSGSSNTKDGVKNLIAKRN
jgi:hypothetical protein